MSKQRVLVVDDDKQIVRLVRSYLEQAGLMVLTAFDGRTALATLRREKPDLLILDLMLPDQDGWDITRQIRGDSRLAATPIIMLTARVEDSDKILGLELGADDYITKPFNPREVVARVRALLRRTRLDGQQSPSLLQTGRLSLDVGRREVREDGRLIDLTPTEFNILQTLMESSGYVFTRGELIEKALGYAYDGIDRTLDSHVRNLRRKIEPDPKNPTYIQTVYGVGYKMTEK
ncbi:MAG: response regulator transcription factor [Anaerolineae bacterium]